MILHLYNWNYRSSKCYTSISLQFTNKYLYHNNMSYINVLLYNIVDFRSPKILVFLIWFINYYNAVNINTQFVIGTCAVIQ